MAKSLPNSHLPSKTIRFEEDDIDLTMTYGMLSEILKFLGDSEEAVMILLTDANVRDYVVRRLFTDTRTPVEKVEDLISPFEIDLNPLNLDILLAWVADHVTHFTLSTAQKAQAVVQKYEDQAASLSPLKSGSES